MQEPAPGDDFLSEPVRAKQQRCGELLEQSGKRGGVRAVCADCHVPKAWEAKLWRKIQATFKELPHKILGTINTPEKFEAKRLELAEQVWAAMKATNSRECRNCHDLATMTLDTQKRRAFVQHEDAKKSGETCIDCHQGIAHKEPRKPG